MSIIFIGDIFGSHLVTLCEKEKASIPRFVQDCIEAIELAGLVLSFIHEYQYLG